MKSTSINPWLKLALIFGCGVAFLFGTGSAQAQLGSGWNVYTPTERLEYETNDILFTISPAPSSFNNGFCAYDKSGIARTFQLLKSSSNRIEIRPNDDYSTGTHQFQADIVMTPPTSGECLHQIFNGSAGPWCIIRQYTNYNGSIRIFAGASTSYVATNLNNRSFRLNTINDMNSGQCYFYVNGRLVYQTTNPGGTFYTKYGTYGTHDNAHPAYVVFTNATLFTGGNETGAGNGDFSLSASPSSESVIQGHSVTNTITETDLNGYAGTVDLSVSGLPSGVTASLSPNPTTGTSTLILTASSTATTGTATVTITGTDATIVGQTLTHSTTVNLTVNSALDFSLSASPNSLTITQGNNGTSTITVNPINGFSGSVNLSASGLPDGVTASFNPSSTTSTSTLTLTASGTATTGTATVTITGTSGSLQHTTTISLTVNPSVSLPAGWTDADIGAVGLAGSASYSSGTFTVSGSGADIWNIGDQFNYVYQSVSNDMTIIARVVSEDGTASYAKAGVMIRETLATNSIEASVLVTPTNGVAMEVRSTTGAATINVAGWVRSISPPQWVKLVRSGDTFTTYYSADGSSWTQIASTNVTMNSSATAGLAVTSHDNTALNTATFDNVSVIEGSTLDTSKIYKLQNEASGLVLNNQGSLTNGSAITQWTATTTSSNLDWTFIATSGGYYQINSCKSGLDAVVQGASTANGAGIIQWSFGSSGNDQWKPVANSDGSYTFYNLHSGLVLEDPGSSTNKTTQMDQWSANGGSNQKWMLLPQ